MWLAGFAMLILSMGSTLLVVVSGKLGRNNDKDPAGPGRLDGVLSRKP
ncbi:MAG TPA: hypothetical protein VJT49_14515 [Amycolatopsis sp.]|nr:hypothetical protein [Amycolatopsis sp.]HKS46294.1 hypothetical protein [Amycolatopsis sp.]